MDLSKENKMALSKLDGIELPAAADMHVHLRDGPMTDLVVYGNLDSTCSILCRYADR